MELDWQWVKRRYKDNPNSYTKNGNVFTVCKVSDSALFIDLPCGEQSVSRSNLEKAVQLINRGLVISGPSDYKKLVYDERPAYAWAILRDFGFIE